MRESETVFAAIGSCDPLVFQQALKPCWDDVTTSLGNLDEDYMQWLGAVVRLSKESAPLVARAWREDCKFEVELCDKEDQALEAAMRLTHFRD